SLGERFFKLPVEIQLQIINLISLYDLLNLRQSSRSFRQLTINHENYLVNAYIRTSVPVYALCLFPPPKKIPTLQYVVELTARQKISTSLAYHLAEQIMKAMMGRRQRRAMECGIKERMLRRLRRGMAPLVLTLMHFFETYTMRKLQRLGNGSQDSVSILSPEKNMLIQSDIMSQYSDSMLLPLHQMFHLLLHLFFRRMTPSSLPIVRVLRRWAPSCPPSNSFAKVFVFGGIKQMWRLYRIKGYGRRRRALDKYVKTIDVVRFQWLGRSSTTDITSGTPAKSSTSTNKVTNLGNKPSIKKLAPLDVDDLLNLWTPAAEEHLLSREIVQDLDEVGCCGRFVSLLLTGPEDDDDEEEEEEEGYEDDESDSEDEGEYQESAATYGIMTGDYDESHWEAVLADGMTEDEYPDY
ncbi:hypothetical protein BDD12DRAFT_730439, partial [Trichophaea hybrida]